MDNDLYRSSAQYHLPVPAIDEDYPQGSSKEESRPILLHLHVEAFPLKKTGIVGKFHPSPVAHVRERISTGRLLRPHSYGRYRWVHLLVQRVLRRALLLQQHPMQGGFGHAI